MLMLKFINKKMSELKYKILKEEFDISQGLLKDLTKVVDELMKENKKLKKIIKIQALEKRVKELEDILSSFDWEIWGNHALTRTCTRLTDDQIKLLEGGE